jgi:hypothetical protein
MMSKEEFNERCKNAKDPGEYYAICAVMFMESRNIKPKDNMTAEEAFGLVVEFALNMSEWALKQENRLVNAMKGVGNA